MTIEQIKQLAAGQPFDTEEDFFEAVRNLVATKKKRRNYERSNEM